MKSRRAKQMSKRRAKSLETIFPGILRARAATSSRHWAVHILEHPDTGEPGLGIHDGLGVLGDYIMTVDQIVKLCADPNFGPHYVYGDGGLFSTSPFIWQWDGSKWVRIREGQYTKWMQRRESEKQQKPPAADGEDQ